MGLFRKWVAPWENAGEIDIALRKVEDVAVSHGFAGQRRPSFPLSDILDVELRMRAALPSDLRRLLEWYCKPEWSWFVNPDWVRLSDGNVIAHTGEQISLDHPDDEYADLIAFDETQRIKLLEVGSADDRFLNQFSEDVKSRGHRSIEWLGAKVIRFGGSL